MTLIDAIKSGKRFRASPDHEWRNKYPGINEIYISMSLIAPIFSMEDVLHDRWEIEEEV